jgi:perosamine synthetase
MWLPASPPLTLRLRALGQEAASHDTAFPSQAMLYARCRFALCKGLQGLGRTRGLQRLWMPAYLCCCVLEAVEAAGIEPALYDVGGRLQPRLESITPEAGDGLLIVHYFGLLAPMDAAVGFCREHDMALVEDCAHTIPDPASPVRAGACGSFAVFSPRKQAPVPGGGLLVVNDPALRAAIEPPPRLGLGDARTLGRLALMLVERAGAAVGCNGLRLKDRLPVVDVARAAPARQAHVPTEYGRPPRPSVLIPPLLRRVDWAAIIAERREAYRRLATALDGMDGVTLPVPVAPAGSVPQALPLHVGDPDEVARRLRRRGIEAMCWPGIEQFAIDRPAFPGTQQWLAHSLCLPLGYSPTRRRMAWVVEAVRDAVAPLSRGASVAAPGRPRAIGRPFRGPRGDGPDLG